MKTIARRRLLVATIAALAAMTTACTTRHVLEPVISSTPVLTPPAPVARVPPSRPVPTSGVAQIAVDDRYGCARRVDGTVLCWGHGALGDGTESQHNAPVAVHGITTATSLFSGDGFMCAGLRDHTTRCWGSLMWFDTETAPGTLEPREMTNLAGVDIVYASGTSEGCAHKPDGTITCWGGGAGALAAGPSGGATWEPLRKELAGTTQLAFSTRFACAVMADATVRCWGKNDHGQLGIGTIGGNRDAPVRVAGLAHITQVAVGSDSACALRKDGTVACWGRDKDGQLGDGGQDTDRGRAETVAGVSDVIELVAGDDHMLALHRDLTVSCWGYNISGQCGTGTAESPVKPAVIPALHDVVGLSASLWNTCAVLRDGTALCWGDGKGGANGEGGQMDRHEPTPIRWTAPQLVDRGLPAGVHVTAIEVDSGLSCAALSDGTTRCWGDDTSSEVSGIVSDPGNPAVLVPTAVANLPRVASFATEYKMVARLSDGRVATWGQGSPVTILPGLPVDAVAASFKYTCVLRRGTATCTDSTHNVVAVTAPATSVSAGGDHACAVMTNHTVQCVGENDHGELGDGTLTARARFVSVVGLADAEQVAATHSGTCARRTGGELACWGPRDQTGNDGDGDMKAPVAVPDVTGVVDVFGGYNGYCARLKTGAVWCWGDFDQPYTRDRYKPVLVPFLEGATQIRIGVVHACALFTDGHVGCWGENMHGELGDQTATDSLVATRVRW